MSTRWCHLTVKNIVFSGFLSSCCFFMTGFWIHWFSVKTCLRPAATDDALLHFRHLLGNGMKRRCPQMRAEPLTDWWGYTSQKVYCRIHFFTSQKSCKCHCINDYIVILILNWTIQRLFSRSPFFLFCFLDLESFHLQHTLSTLTPPHHQGSHEQGY